MGILNVTPDSFYDGGKFSNEQLVLKQVEGMAKSGVDILDIGGYSSRPGAEHIDEAEEHGRVIPYLIAINREFPSLIISIDTFRSGIAKEAVLNGATMINDISGGEMDGDMFETVADLKVPYVLMHMRGTPQTMQEETDYNDPISELLGYFIPKLNELKTLGVKDVVVDPGFGFGKNIDANYQILYKLNALAVLELPILAGLSRKSMIGKLLGMTDDQTLKGTMALNLIALIGGATILRVHDVPEGKEMIDLFQRLTGAN